MNERIKLLAEQATNDVKDEFGHWINSEFNKEKFAELIVRECCDILDPGEHQLIARFQARKWLQEHFGVER